jgi:hypothetical protein
MTAAMGLTRQLADSLYQPHHPGFISTWYGGIAGAGNSGGFTANEMIAARVVVPMTGQLRDVSFMTTVASGNYDIGVYDTTATTRTRLGSKGSTAFGAAGTWNTYDPNIAVTAGQSIDLAISCNNAVATIPGDFSAREEFSKLPANFIPTTGGGAPYLLWHAFTAFPCPATVSEASLFTYYFVPLIIARIS